jgi:hypothetical protein
MQAHQPTRIARTLAEAELLGHEDTELRASIEQLERGMQLATDIPKEKCWEGICGDPEPHVKLVKYNDANGLCNIYKKVTC